MTKHINICLILTVMATTSVISGCQDKGIYAEREKSLGLEWVRIEGGTFMMGNTGRPTRSEENNERPQHEESIGTFEALKTEVTTAQFKQCINDNVCTKTLNLNRNCNFQKDDRGNHPINCINWHQANTFCAYVGGRLPYEAEWEYMATSGGKDYKYPWGNEEADCERSNFDLTEKGSGCGTSDTFPVCSFAKGNSEQGLCDLSGNVIEWVRDWYLFNYRYDMTEVPKIKNFATGKVDPNRVMRGGGIGTSEDNRARNRIYHDEAFQYSGLGVRCIRDVEKNRPLTNYEKQFEKIERIAPERQR